MKRTILRRARAQGEARTQNGARTRARYVAFAFVGSVSVFSACGGSNTDSRFPPRAPGCEMKLFHGKVIGAKYDNIGGVDAICGTDIGNEACLTELKNQACKLGGDIVYDVPDDPEKPSPDKVRYTGRVAHSRAAPR